ncbi:MAG: fibronectin type III domain-containing protein [Acutalibacteraceae bacterium]
MAVIMLLSVAPLAQLGDVDLFGTRASAASYPTCFPGNYNMEASVGETVKLVYDYVPAFKNEKLITKIYNSDGVTVGSAEQQTYNTSSFSSYTLTWDTEGYKPGQYKVEMSYEFYSYYQWNTAPNSSTRYVTLKDNINQGAKDKNKYTGNKEYFSALSDKSVNLGTNTLCEAVSAWQKNNIKSEKYSIQLMEMYIGDKADAAVKEENSFNLGADSDDQWIFMSFNITNNSSQPIEISDILYMHNFYKYTGTKATVFDSATISDEKNDIYSDDIEAGESEIVWIGLRIPLSSGMPYLRVENGGGYTFLNINPDLVSGKKKAGHSFGSWTVTKKATTTSTGTKTRKCSVCGKTEKQTIDKLPAKAISKCSFSSISSKTYTGKAIKPTVTVKDGSKTLKAGTHYTVTYKNNTKIGKATVTLKGIEKAGYTGTKSISFNIIPATPTLKATAGTKKAALSWNKISGATGYEVYMATSKGGSYKKVATVKGKTSYTKTGLSKGKTYYFKVRAYKTVSSKNYYSGYSSVKSAKIK